jgi:hypothetical protein
MKRTMTPLLAILAIAGSVVWIYRSQSGSSQKFDLSPYQALGAGVAEETGKLIGNKGAVVVISPDTSEFKNEAIEGQLDSFQKGLAKSGLTIAGSLKFKLKPMERMTTGGAVPRDQFLQALQSHPNVDAVVLFCVFPQLGPQEYATLKQSGVKVVAASACVPGYRRLLETQVIHLAIVPQFDRPATLGNKPSTLRGWFEQDFLVITAANAATLPY